MRRATTDQRPRGVLSFAWSVSLAGSGAKAVAPTFSQAARREGGDPRPVQAIGLITAHRLRAHKQRFASASQTQSGSMARLPVCSTSMIDQGAGRAQNALVGDRCGLACDHGTLGQGKRREGLPQEEKPWKETARFDGI